MFSFNVVLPENWNDKETLPNTPVEDITFHSPLGIVVSCLQGDFAQILFINKNKPPFGEMAYRQFSDVLKHLREEESIEDRERFFLKNCESLTSTLRLVGEEKDLSKREFQILCDFLKKTTNLNHLYLQSEGLYFTEEEEQELISVLKENASIQMITISGGTEEMANAIRAINRPSLQLFTGGLISRETVKFRTDDQYRAQKVQQFIDERNSKHAQAVQDTMNMHILQSFVAVLGAAAVATAFILLSAASLNLAGVALAALGTGALAWSTHSFFSYIAPECKSCNISEQRMLKRILNVPLDEESKNNFTL